MDIEAFLEIVDDVAASSIIPKEKRSILMDKLAVLSGEEVYAFDEILTSLRDRAYRWDIRGVAYIIGEGCGDDSFDDFRYTQVFRGHAAFERLLNDPDSIGEEEFENAERECFFEGLQYVPTEVLEGKTDFFYPDDNYVHPAELAGTRWDQSELPDLFPKTWAKYGWKLNS